MNGLRIIKKIIMKKLSRAQQSVVDKMLAGCRLYRSKRISYLMPAVGIRIESSVNLNTFESLKDKGIISFLSYGFNGSELYCLSEKYKNKQI